MKAGWQTKPFDECIEKVTYTSKIQRKDFLVDGAYPIISQEDAFINGYWDHRADLFKITTPVVVFGDHTKVLKYVDFDFVLGADGVKILQPKSFLLPKFFYYQLQTANLHSLGYARHYKLLKELIITYPSLSEQQRIVGILDQAFAGIATAKANAEKNLQNARALFESHLQSVFTQRGDGWIRKKLGDVFKTSTGSTPPKNNSEFYGSFMPLVKPPELCGEAFDSATDGLSEAGAAVARTIPAKSVLVSCIGNLGKIGYNTVPVAFNQQINAILPNESQAIPEFMFFQSLSFFFKSQLETFASGTTIPIVNKSKFNSVNVVLPPLRIQKLVVPQLSSLREETHNLESIYKQKLTALDELKKSLLHQAFSGQL